MSTRKKLGEQLAEAEQRLQAFANKGVVGEKLMTRGADLAELLSTKAGMKEVNKLMAAGDGETHEMVISRRVNQLVSHLEKELFGAGGGDVNRTGILLQTLLDRPAVKRMLLTKATLIPRSQKIVDTAAKMLEHGASEHVCRMRPSSPSICLVPLAAP